MNMRQAIALGLGTLVGIGLVLSPRWQTSVRHVSTETLPNGDIVSISRSRQVFWQPYAFGLVVLVTGLLVYRLRTVPD